MPFDFDFPRLFDFATSLIALGRWQFTAIESGENLAREQAKSGEQLHHSVQKPFHLLLVEFAYVIRQALGRDRALFPFGFALRVSSLRQSLLTLLSIETNQFHQREIAKEHTRQFMHRLAATEHFEQIEQDKLNGWYQHPLHVWQHHFLKDLHHSHFFQKGKKLIQQSCLAEFMHFLYCFPCI